MTPRGLQPLLLFASFLKDSTASHALTVASLDYHRRATTELRSRLSTDNDCAGDGILMAVGVLVSLNILQGDMKAANNHVNGLKQLVLLRGRANLQAFDGYLRERILGQFAMWDFTQLALKIDSGPFIYPKHPYPPDLCGHISKFPPGLEELALSGSINVATIRLLAGIQSCSSRILASNGRRPADARKMLTFVYALSRQARVAKLNTIEHILVMVLVEACVLLGSTRNLHWVIITCQQLRLRHLLSTKSARDVLKDTTYRHALIWMGSVLLATNNVGSDSWRLGKDLVDEKGRSMEWSERIELCERYIWYDELSVRLAQNWER